MIQRVMKERYWLLGMVLLWALVTMPAQGQSEDTTFAIWLLNNEAQFMNILATDRGLMKKLELPLGLIPQKPRENLASEDALWAMHLKIYPCLREIVDILSTARRVGGGAFAGNLGKAYPGTWVTLPFIGFPAVVARFVGRSFDQEARGSIMKALGIQSSEDANFAGRLEKTIKNLSDSHRRLLEKYLEHYCALFPGEKPSQALYNMVKNGMKRDWSNRLAGSLSPLVGDRKAEKSPDSASSEANAEEYASLLDTAKSPSGDEANPGGYNPPPGSADASQTPGLDTMAASGSSDPGQTAGASSSAATPPGDDMFNILH